jgi:hypothetical protein
MGLLIVAVVLNRLIRYCAVEIIHWADNRLDERNLRLGKAVLLVKFFVRPRLGNAMPDPAPAMRMEYTYGA